MDSYQPTDGTGSRLDEIPFYFIGSENNDEEIDDAPLYDLCVLNIAHYRNSADYEEGVFICGQPWVYVSGLDAAWFKDQMGGKIKGGSGNGIPLPKDGSMGIIQAQPNTIAKEAMDQKEDQMIKLGARLIEQGSANKTATQSENDNATSHSVLSLVCENVSQAYEQAIKMCARFMNEDDSAIEYRINLDAGMKSIDAQALNAVVAAWMQRAFGRTQLLRALRRMDLVDPDKTDEELLDEIDQQVI